MLTVLVVLLLFGTVITSNNSGAYNSDVSFTNYGSVKGKLAKGYHDGILFKEFLSIPYARAPIGRLRFQAPVRPKAWLGNIYDATHYRNSCMQTPEGQTAIQSILPRYKYFSEDCLHLSVFTSYDFSKSLPLYPVLVYFHGGSFSTGSPVTLPHHNMSSHRIIRHDIILVTVQYRLGAFGFLSSGDIGGNYGLLDQLLALKWVRENILHFGGDPGKVTLMGHGAGAASVSLHMVSPISRGLFQQAILHSGVAMSPWATHTNHRAKESMLNLAKQLNCYYPGYSYHRIVGCLKEKDANSIANSQSQHWLWPDRLQWAPVVDGSLIPTSPHILYRKGQFHKIRLLAGYSVKDSQWFIKNTVKPALGGNYSESVDDSLFSLYLKRFLESRDVTDPEEAHRALLFRYTARGPRPTNRAMATEQMVQLCADYLYEAPVYESLSTHSLYNSTYWFVMNYDVLRPGNINWTGLPYGDDLSYLFGVPFMEQYTSQFTDVDRNISYLVTKLWTNFIKHGNGWERFSERNKKRFSLSEISMSEKVTRLSSLEFWISLFPTFKRKVRAVPDKSSTQSPYGIYIALTYVLSVVTLALLVAMIWMSVVSCRRPVPHPVRTTERPRSQSRASSAYSQVPSSTYVSYDFYDNHELKDTRESSMRSFSETVTASGTTFCEMVTINTAVL